MKNKISTELRTSIYRESKKESKICFENIIMIVILSIFVVALAFGIYAGAIK